MAAPRCIKHADRMALSWLSVGGLLLVAVYLAVVITRWSAFAIVCVNLYRMADRSKYINIIGVINLGQQTIWARRPPLYTDCHFIKLRP